MKQRPLVNALGIIVFTAAFGAVASAEVIEKAVEVGPIDWISFLLSKRQYHPA